MQKMTTPGPLEKNLLEAVNQQGSSDIFNAFADKTGAITKRPGLTFCQTLITTKGVQALYYWPSKKIFVAVAGGEVWSTPGLTNPFVKVSDPLNKLPLGQVKIVDTGRWLYFCGVSGKMMYWNGTDSAVFVPDAVAPVNVSTIATLNQRMLANERGTNRVWYTKPASLTTPADPLEWDSYFAYGRNNEDIIGLEVSGNELIAFKRDSFQAFFDDGVTPYKPIIGSQKFYGLVSASATCRVENAVFFVSPDRVVRMLMDREVRDISTPRMGIELQRLLAFDEVVLLPLESRVLVLFPNEDKCYSFDPIFQSWNRMTSYKDGNDKAFIARATTVAVSAGQTNLWLVGGSDASIYFWDYSAFTDNSEPIRFLVRTPHMGWGTANRKQTTRLVAKVSLEPLRLAEIPDINFPDATRCELYFHEFTLPEGASVVASGFPTGFSWVQNNRVVTISGATEDFSGPSEILLIITDARGAQYRVSKTFIVHDVDTIDINVFTGGGAF